MSKRKEIRQRRQRERTRNRILVISLVAVGALLVAFAFIRPLVLENSSHGHCDPSLGDSHHPEANCCPGEWSSPR